MIIDDITYDIIVVGTGGAGGTLAGDLAGNLTFQRFTTTERTQSSNLGGCGRPRYCHPSGCNGNADTFDFRCKACRASRCTAHDAD